MINAYSVIKDLVKLVDQTKTNDPASLQNDIEDFLAKNSLNKNLILNIADEIGVSLKVDSNNADDLEKFSDFLKVYLLEFTKSIRIYLEIIKVIAYKASVYRNLIDIYLYDPNLISEFDFIGNAKTQFSTPSHSVDPLFFCMSYTFIGILSQRLGRFLDARVAFNEALKFRDDPRKITKTAEYGNLELDYLANITQMNFSHTHQSSLSKNHKPMLVIGTIFFGAEYERLFRQSAGASFFCNSNVTALKQNWNPVVVIFCTLFNKMDFVQSELYKKISASLQVEIIILPEELTANHPDPTPPGLDAPPALAYSLSGLLQTCLLIITRQLNASLITIPPDAIFSNITVSEINYALNNGKKVVFTPGIRLERDKILHTISTLVKENANSELALSPAQLTNIALANLHPATKAAFLTNEKITHPGLLFWPVGKDGLFAHCFQMHPIFIAAELIKQAPIRRFDSIDGDFIYTMMPDSSDWEYIHVVTSPDRAMMFELSGSNIPTEIKYDTNNLVYEASSWITNVMRPLSFWLLEKRVVFGNKIIATHENLKRADYLISELSKLGLKLKYNRLSKSKAMSRTAMTDLMKLAKQWKIDGSSLYINNKVVIPTQLAQDVKTIRIIYSIAVWGKRYIENFLHICLPSMLAEGNLQDAPNKKNSLFLLYTQDENISLFEENTQYHRLKKLIPVEIISIHPEKFSQKYAVLSAAQSDTVQRSRTFDAVCFLYSDFLWAKGGMNFCIKKIAEGYDGVITPVPPVIKERLYETLNEYFEDFICPSKTVEGAYNIAINSRKLVQYAKPILHPMMRDNIIDYKTNTSSPAYVLWLGPQDDLLIRCFHSHPAMLKVKHNTPAYWMPFEQTLDEGFLPRAYPATDQLYFVQDSDELAIISMTEEDFPTPYAGENYHLDAQSIAQWAEGCAAPMQKMSFNYPVLWHEYEINYSDWEATIQRSGATAEEVKFRLSMPDLTLQSECPAVYLTRMDRAHRCGYSTKGQGITLTNPIQSSNTRKKNKRKQTYPIWLFKFAEKIGNKLPSGIKKTPVYLNIKNHFRTRQPLIIEQQLAITPSSNKHLLWALKAILSKSLIFKNYFKPKFKKINLK